MIWAETLPPGTSAQRAELIALAQALRMAEGKRLNVYTDSRYAFATAHIHGEIYKRRGLLTSEGKAIKNKMEILELLRALFLPSALSIIHTPGHQKGDSIEARGNRLADQAAREAAVRESTEAFLVRADPEDGPPLAITYLELIKKMGATYDPISRLWVHQSGPHSKLRL